MFEVSSMPEHQVPDHDLPSPTRKTDRKPKAHSFAALTAVLQDWRPGDSLALRRQLVNEAKMLLEGENYNCVRSCIPAVVVDKQYPVDLLHYDSE